jgi:hypothetical protein
MTIVVTSPLLSEPRLGGSPPGPGSWYSRLFTTVEKGARMAELQDCSISEQMIEWAQVCRFGNIDRRRSTQGL